MRVTANYTYKNKNGKKAWATHELEYSVPKKMEQEVLDELMIHDIKEKTGRKVKKLTTISLVPDDIKRM